MRKLSILMVGLITALVLVACGNSEESTTLTFTASLSGDNEVPAVETDATGSAELELDGNDFTLTGSYTGLVATAAHIHGPASETENAGVVTALEASDGTLSGSGTLTDEQVNDLKDGKYYINVHTEANPGGELRGQLTE